MRSAGAVAMAAGLALLAGGCAHTYACASAGAPGGPAKARPPRGWACPGAPRASTAPPALARLSGSGQLKPVVAVVGQRIVAAVRSPDLPLQSIPAASRPGVLCDTSAVPGTHVATVVFIAWHPGSVLVRAFAGGSGCGDAEELIYGVKIVVRSP
jgi:hypothetical protein